MTDRTQRTHGTSEAQGPDALRREAARKRQELGETIEQLVAKADVKRRAAHLVHDRTPEAVRVRAGHAVETGRRHPGPVLAVGAAALAGGILLGRKLHNGHTRR
ncbi:DUF3618 domain-containing protein [Streptomyces sp. NPDC047928]|uniref:DUF3618 domain-containing protein n=1 Tax=unclassified Streptomyces TaxID=2593676 RepID=UPI0037209CCB